MPPVGWICLIVSSIGKVNYGVINYCVSVNAVLLLLFGLFSSADSSGAKLGKKDYPKVSSDDCLRRSVEGRMSFLMLY